MTNQNAKPREFYIQKGTPDIIADEITEYGTTRLDLMSPIIHVIEISAITAKDAEIAELTRQNKVLREALEFYTHFLTWTRRHKSPDDIYLKADDTYLNEFGTVVGGKKAREALKSCGGGAE